MLQIEDFKEKCITKSNENWDFYTFKISFCYNIIGIKDWSI